MFPTQLSATRSNATRGRQQTTHAPRHADPLSPPATGLVGTPFAPNTKSATEEGKRNRERRKGRRVTVPETFGHVSWFSARTSSSNAPARKQTNRCNGGRSQSRTPSAVEPHPNRTVERREALIEEHPPVDREQCRRRRQRLHLRAAVTRQPHPRGANAHTSAHRWSQHSSHSSRGMACATATSVSARVRP